MKSVLVLLVMITATVSLNAESITSVTRQSSVGGHLRSFSLSPDDILRERFACSEYGYFGVKNICSTQKSGTFAREFGSISVADMYAIDSIHRRSPIAAGKEYVQFKTDCGNTYTMWDRGPQMSAEMNRFGPVLDSLFLSIKNRYAEDPEITDQPDTVAIARGVFPYLCFPIWENGVMLESDQKVIPYIADFLKKTEYRKVTLLGTLSATKKEAAALQKYAAPLALTVKNQLVKAGVDGSKLVPAGIIDTFRGSSAVLPAYVKIVIEK